MLSRTKLIIVAVGFVFGIPTSIVGMQLKEGMFLKQMINCQEDASNSVLSLLDGDLTSIKGSDFEDIGGKLKSCSKDINPRIGVVKFLHNEHERNSNNI